MLTPVSLKALSTHTRPFTDIKSVPDKMNESIE